MRSHEDIYDLVERAVENAAAAKAAADKATTDIGLYTLAVQNVQNGFRAVTDSVADLRTAIGSAGEDEHGQMIGTGLVGKVERLTKHVGDRFKLYDRWMALAIGGIAVGVPMALAIWWLVQDRLAAVLK